MTSEQLALIVSTERTGPNVLKEIVAETRGVGKAAEEVNAKAATSAAAMARALADAKAGVVGSIVREGEAVRGVVTATRSATVEMKALAVAAREAKTASAEALRAAESGRLLTAGARQALTPESGRLLTAGPKLGAISAKLAEVESASRSATVEITKMGASAEQAVQVLNKFGIKAREVGGQGGAPSIIRVDEADLATATAMVRALGVESLVTSDSLEVIAQKAKAASASTRQMGTVAQFAARQAVQGNVSVAASQRAVSTHIDQSIGAVTKLAQEVDVTSARQVAGFRAMVAAGRDFLQTSGATAQQYVKLNAAAELVERGVKAAGTAGTQAMVGFGRTAQQTAAEVTQVAAATGRIGGQTQGLRRGARALSTIAFAAQSATLGGTSAAFAFGNLATSLGAVANSAKLAAAASGIGAIVVVATTLLGLLDRIGAKRREIEQRAFQRDLGATDVHTAGKLLDRLKDQKKELEAQEKVITRVALIGTPLGPMAGMIDRLVVGLSKSLGVGVGRELRALDDRMIEVQERIKDEQLAAARAAVERNRVLRQSAEEQIAQADALEIIERRRLALASGMVAARGADFQQSLNQFAAVSNDFALRVRAAEEEARQRRHAIALQFELRDGDGHLLGLTVEQVRFRDKLLEQLEMQLGLQRRSIELEKERAQAELGRTVQRESPLLSERVQGRLEEIEEERQASIRATGDVEKATRIAEQRKRALFWDTARAGADSLKTISDAASKSRSGTVRAIGAIANATRRFIIGAEAADAAVKSAKSFGMVPVALAAGDPWGAALFAAGGVQLAAAAALGFKEALGGGGGGGGSASGGGGGASGGATFEPKRPEGAGGGLVVNLFTTDPYGSGNIRRVMYEVNRAGVLNKPIYLPPTSGLQGAA